MGMFREENAKLNADAPRASARPGREVRVIKEQRGYTIGSPNYSTGRNDTWAFEKITDLADFLIEHFEPGTIGAEVKEMMAGPLAKCDDPACLFCNEQPANRASPWVKSARWDTTYGRPCDTEG